MRNTIKCNTNNEKYRKTHQSLKKKKMKKKKKKKKRSSGFLNADTTAFLSHISKSVGECSKYEEMQEDKRNQLYFGSHDHCVCVFEETKGVFSWTIRYGKGYMRTFAKIKIGEFVRKLHD